MQEYQSEAQQWSQDFGFSENDGVGEFYSLFRAIRQLNPLGLTGQPFVLRHDELVGLASFAGYFTFDDLAQALQDDFLDAGRGSTDNRKGWKVRTLQTQTHTHPLGKTCAFFFILTHHPNATLSCCLLFVVR